MGLPNRSELEDLREKWEGDMSEKLSFEGEWGMCAVLIGEEGEYHLHRYFLVGDNWEVSIDNQVASGEESVDWISENMNE